MKDLQTVEKFQQAQAEKWAKKEKDIHLQVCFKKAVDVEKRPYYNTLCITKKA